MNTTENRNCVYELMQAVNVLTLEHDVVVDDRHGKFLGSRRENPLLVKLKGATASNMGGAGAGKPGRERTPMNVGARDLFDRIHADIAEWYGRETDYAENGRPEAWVTLRQWFIRYANRARSGQVTDESVWARVREVEAWERQIRDLLDPPHRFPLTAPCPNCGQEWVEAYSVDDPNEIERVRVLNAVEREKIEDSYVLCRACDKVWRGVYEARALRIAIDDAELAKGSL